MRKQLASLPRPLVWVNAAGFTQVDRCEREPELARRVNAVAPAVLAQACAEAGVRLVHVSTDYVFPGDARRPYREDDPTGPRSVYGRTKLAGDQAVLSRVARLPGRPHELAVREAAATSSPRCSTRRRRAARARPPARCAWSTTRRGRPTYAVDLAEAIVQLVSVGARGVVHVANAGHRHLVGPRALRARRGRLSRTSRSTGSGRATSATDAARPAWSVLDTARAEALGVKMRSWQEAVTAYLRSDHSPLAKLEGGSIHA